jgi:hypothetical protein
MQEVVEELIRWIGYAALRVVTLGRYRGGTMNDRLPEGAAGLGVIMAVIYFTYRLSA